MEIFIAVMNWMGLSYLLEKFVGIIVVRFKLGLRYLEEPRLENYYS